MCDDFMRKLGAQDNIKEEALSCRHPLCTRDAAPGKDFCCMQCQRDYRDAVQNDEFLFPNHEIECELKGGHLHKERVEPNER